MTIVIEDVQGAKEPVTLDAPVILDATDPAQANELLQFIDTLKWARVADVARAEARRLSKDGYFMALSAYARGALPRVESHFRNYADIDRSQPPNLETARAFLDAEKIPYTEEDGLLHVKGSIRVNARGLKRLPDLRCVQLAGTFDCRSNGLVSLFGMPRMGRVGTLLADVNPLLDLSDIAAEQAGSESPGYVQSDLYAGVASDIPKHLFVRRVAAQEIDNMKKTTTPFAIRAMFCKLAAAVKVSLISDVVIIPSNIKTAPETKSLFGGKDRYDQPYQTPVGSFSFGFYQINQKDSGPGQQQSSTFATFTVDQDVLAPLGQTKTLLKELQAVMTIVNHDMLHHLTSPVVRGNVAEKHGSVQTISLPIHRWGERVRRYSADGNALPYENWAQLTHEKVNLARDPSGAATQKHVDAYFDELQRLAASSASAEKDKIRDAVNYAALVMGHALTRVYPLDHPLMTHCLNRMVQADPEPARSWEDALLLTTRKKEASADRAATLKDYPDASSAAMKIADGFAAAMAVLDQYGLGAKKADADAKAGGLGTYLRGMFAACVGGMLGRSRNVQDPRALKLLQLTHISAVDVLPHMPKPADKGMAAMRRDGDEITLDMLSKLGKSLRHMR